MVTFSCVLSMVYDHSQVLLISSSPLIQDNHYAVSMKYSLEIKYIFVYLGSCTVHVPVNGTATEPIKEGISPILLHMFMQ